MEPDIAQQTNMAEARAVSPAYPYGNQAMFRAQQVEVDAYTLLVAKEDSLLYQKEPSEEKLESVVVMDPRALVHLLSFLTTGNT